MLQIAAVTSYLVELIRELLHLASGVPAAV
jgi:hypothetical protein